MDDTFLIGSAAFVSAILVFVGSVWLLLALVLGPRLSYLVTATVTLGFVLIMAVVWSIGTPLGPVGQLPGFDPIDIGEDPNALNFGPAASYPESPWRPPSEDDEADQTRSAELETAALDYLEDAIEAGDIDTFESASDAQVAPDSGRLLDEDGDVYGAVTLEPIPAGEEEGAAAEEEEAPSGTVVAVMEFDPGNPNAPARRIAIGSLILFAGHLWFLSRAERNAQRKKEAEGDQGTGS